MLECTGKMYVYVFWWEGDSHLILILGIQRQECCFEASLDCIGDSMTIFFPKLKLGYRNSNLSILSLPD